MARTFPYKSLASVMGSWPAMATGKAGPVQKQFSLLPRSLISQAEIMGARQEPTLGFDVGSKTFDVVMDGSIYPVTFTAANKTLAEVIAQINSDVGSTVAFNVNSFLALRSTTVGQGSSMGVETGISGPDVLAELGLYPGIYSYYADPQQAAHVDPLRQVAYPGQMSLSAGEPLDGSSFNRLAFQTGVNADHSYNFISKRRLAIQKRHVDNPYTPGNKGVTVADEVYKNPATLEIGDIFAVLDLDGNEIVEEVEAILDSSGINTVQAWVDSDDGLQHVSVAGAGIFQSDDAENNIYVKFSNLSPGDGNGIPFKIIDYVSSGEVVIEPTDPSDGSKIAINQGPSATIDLDRISITPTVVQVAYVKDGVGGSDVWSSAVSRSSAESVARVELNNRIVCSGADFVTDGVQVGDIVTWTGSGNDNPFNNNGTYRVSAVVDLNTLELVDDSYGPVFLNPIEVGGYGAVDVDSDPEFWTNPFLEFNIETSASQVHVLYLALSTLKDALNYDRGLLTGSGVRYSQEADANLQKAVLNMIGPSVGSFSEYLYGHKNLNLEDLYNLVNDEHDKFGRHTTINPDKIDMFDEAATGGVSGETVTVRGSTTDTTTTKKVVVRDSGGTAKLYITATGRMAIGGDELSSDEALTVHDSTHADGVVSALFLNDNMTGSGQYNAIGIGSPTRRGSIGYVIHSSLSEHSMFFGFEDGNFNSDEFWMCLTRAGRLGVGYTLYNPEAMLHVKDVVELGSGASSYRNARTHEADIGANQAFLRMWTYRPDVGQFRWREGLGIDATGNLPATSKVWWDRDPFGSKFDWGDEGSTWMTLSNTLLTLNGVEGSFGLLLTSPGPVSLTLEADTDDSDERDNPYIGMTQDGGGVAGVFGFCPADGENPRSDSIGDILYTNTLQNAFLLGTETDEPVQFGTNNAVRMTILYTGEVGIGITNPTHALEVVGSTKLNLSGTGYQDVLKLYNGSGLTKFQIDTDGDMLVISGNNLEFNPDDGNGFNVEFDSLTGNNSLLLRRTDSADVTNFQFATGATVNFKITESAGAAGIYGGSSLIIYEKRDGTGNYINLSGSSGVEVNTNIKTIIGNITAAENLIAGDDVKAGSSGSFFRGTYEGTTVTKVFDDNVGNTHTVTIKGGIITGWSTV